MDLGNHSSVVNPGQQSAGARTMQVEPLVQLAVLGSLVPWVLSEVAFGALG